MDGAYREYSGMITGYLKRLCGNEELAHDLAQETFYQAMKSMHRFDERSSVSTWLCGIAKHLYYDAVRRQRPTELLTEQLPSTEDFTEKIVQADQAMAAHHALHELEEPYREVFTLRTFCELSHAQIAELFGKSESWSRVTYFRARLMLLREIKENENEKE